MTEDYASRMTDTDSLKKKDSLVNVLRTIRLEIWEAMEEAEGRSLQFEIEKVELELKVEVVSKVGGDGKIDLKVLSLGAKSETESTTAHTFKFTMKPKLANGNEVLVTDTHTEAKKIR